MSSHGPEPVRRPGGGSVKRLAVILALLAPLNACEEGRRPFWMGAARNELPAGIAPGELPDSDSRGARLVARYCSQCHGIPSPTRHSADEWASVARRMFRRSDHMSSMRGMHRRMAGLEAPSRDARREIVSYLRRHAMASVAEDRFEGAGRAASLFARTCSRCHALPDPAQHTPEEWPAVVERMRDNMRRMQVPAIDDAEARVIAKFLQEEAAKAQGGAGGEP